jgi:hypothetical protein
MMMLGAECLLEDGHGPHTLAAIKGERTMISQLSDQFDVHPNQITSWKAQLEGGAVDLFGPGSGKGPTTPPVGIARSTVYYLPRPVLATDLALMHQIDKLHLEFPFVPKAFSRIARLRLNSGSAST